MNFEPNQEEHDFEIKGSHPKFIYWVCKKCKGKTLTLLGSVPDPKTLVILQVGDHLISVKSCTEALCMIVQGI